MGPCYCTKVLSVATGQGRIKTCRTNTTSGAAPPSTNAAVEAEATAAESTVKLMYARIHHFNRWLYSYIDQIVDSRLIDISKYSTYYIVDTF